MSKTKKSGLSLAIDRFNGIDGLASALGITRQAIYMWRGRVPRLRAFEIEAATGGEIKVSDLLKERPAQKMDAA